MSLADFETAWVGLMLDPQLRQRWRSGEAGLAGLRPAEAEALQAIPSERMEAIAQTVIEGRIAVFLAALPQSLRPLLPESQWRIQAEIYARQDPLATLYPLAQTLPPWLEFLAQTLQDEEIPHLVDLLRYEALQTGLSFYRRPQAAQGPPGTVQLAPFAGLLVAGPQLPAVLQALSRRENFSQIPLTPRSGYLIWRLAFDTRIAPLHWSVYELLQACRVACHWPEQVSELCRKHPQLLTQEQTLLQWEAYYLRQGLLLQN